MEVVIVTQSEVPRLLPMDECMDVMEGALSALARGEAILPLRPVMWLPDRTGAVALMPSYLESLRSAGVKIITVFPGNLGTPYDSHQGAVLLFEAEHGSLLAVIDATAITAIRTAAVSGVATRALAREEAGDLAILGSGTQARTHLEAMRLARDVRRVRVWSRTREHADAFAEREATRHGIDVEIMPTAREAVEGADIVCTTTASTEPVLEGAWLSPGAHINAVGSFLATTRELDTEAVVRSRLYVDRRESALAEAGDFLVPKAEGAVGEDHIVGELGEVLIGTAPGRTSPQDITLFESLGLAIEDLASAHHIHRKARETGIGTRVELGGGRDADG